MAIQGEWCNDYYGKYPDGDATDPSGPENGQGRVLRGGSFYGDPPLCRCAGRGGGVPGRRNNNIGFRLVLDSE